MRGVPPLDARGAGALHVGRTPNRLPLPPFVFAGKPAGCWPMLAASSPPLMMMMMMPLFLSSRVESAVCFCCGFCLCLCLCLYSALALLWLWLWLCLASPLRAAHQPSDIPSAVRLETARHVRLRAQGRVEASVRHDSERASEYERWRWEDEG
ncbi:hypothetical protein AOQ84DRAFT_226427 [Glonium stellatum]|uniref:Uncharacterized protein n=1 Tax=Glonium stellatum TaxID=574774 RepID=A0A8E2ET29_9PEZI|nr:hypothetical protein AOQ84DRAFT_226427 [Glonium stellatum]